MCSRLDCVDGAPGTWRPVLVLAGKKDQPVATRARMQIDVRICDTCKPKVSADEWTKGQFWQSVIDTFVCRGLLRPVADLTVLDFIPLGSDEARAMDVRKPS